MTHPTPARRTGPPGIGARGIEAVNFLGFFLKPSRQVGISNRDTGPTKLS